MWKSYGSGRSVRQNAVLVEHIKDLFHFLFYINWPKEVKLYLYFSIDLLQIFSDLFHRNFLLV